jgi:hypothetical protein
VAQASQPNRGAADCSTEQRRPHGLLLDRPAEIPELAARYLAHALPAGVPNRQRVRLTMTGHIRAGAWLPFTATQLTDAHSFRWDARVGVGPVTLLRVTDSYRDGDGYTEGHLFGKIRVFRHDGPDVSRSAAGRAALESVFAPASLLAQPGLTWRTGEPGQLIASWDIAPEQVELHLQVDDHGTLLSVAALRWGNAGQTSHGYIPCGGTLSAERRFGELVLPSEITVGWWFGTPRYAPFFQATIQTATLLD